MAKPSAPLEMGPPWPAYRPLPQWAAAARPNRHHPRPAPAISETTAKAFPWAVNPPGGCPDQPAV